MNKFKKGIALLILSAMITTPIQNTNAQEYVTDTGGRAYEVAYSSSLIAPAIALGLVAIAGIIAVAVQNRSHSSHNHSHSD